MDESKVTPRPLATRSSGLSASKILIVLCGLAACGAMSYLAFWVHGRLTFELRELQRDFVASDSDAETAVALIGQDTNMDIALVIYARKPNAHTSHPERYDEDRKPEQVDEVALAASNATGYPLVETTYLPEEDVVFSDIVMRDFSHNDRICEVTVAFELPLDRL